MPTFPLPHLDRDAREAHQARILALVILESPEPVRIPTTSYTDPADARLLRGIPAIGGRGSLGGAIAGSRPDTRRL